MKIRRLATYAIVIACSLGRLTVAAADPWADAVVSYNQGSNPAPGFTTAGAALGEPTRFTAPASPFGGVVTPLNASFGSGETVSIGEGGSLVLRFDEPVANDPLNPFGIDLLVFGNSFLVGDFFNQDFSFNSAGRATGVVSEGGVVEVSSDGLDWRLVPGAADGLFPTNGYADIIEPFTSTPGAIPADFTRPVDPTFNLVGKTFSQIIAGYAGSGGGLGVDIGPTGLSSIQYVRITNPTGSGVTPEIDAMADVHAVPEPAAVTTIFVAAGLFAWQNRKRG
jgi:hypothetical protein